MTRTAEKDEPELVESVIVPGGTVRPADGAFQEPEDNCAQAWKWANSASGEIASDLQSGGGNANDFVVTKATAAGDVSSVAGVFRVWLRRLGSRRQAPERQPTLCKRAEIGVFSGQKTRRRQLNGC